MTNPVASLAALLREAAGNSKWLTWSEEYTSQELAEWLLARGVQYAPREPQKIGCPECGGLAAHWGTQCRKSPQFSEAAPPREPPMELLQELYDWLYDHADSEGYGRDAGIFAERLKRYLP